MTAAAPSNMLAQAKILFTKHKIMKTTWATRPKFPVSVNQHQIQQGFLKTTNHIEFGQPQAMYVLLGSSVYKRFPATRRTQSSDCNQQQTRMDRQHHNHNQQKMNRARLLTKATTIICQSGFQDPGEGTYRDHG
jgi:hypothetical protein